MDRGGSPWERREHTILWVGRQGKRASVSPSRAFPQGHGRGARPIAPANLPPVPPTAGPKKGGSRTPLRWGRTS
ncbi:hypothetical protein E2C01_039321 [Portunus trituberculatus]|uniref:Uncharacterized protein n=1 Tax=Portunus trituberculatus TaxID=210409 RepID=A0A5B7FJK5_PORTR|nr:hypothetical protein [Portunus trituberculatus]